MSLVTDILDRELSVLALDIIRRSTEAGQRASGVTYENIRVEVTEGDGKARGKITAPVWFHTLIRGRGPGKIPKELPAIIADWARAKGISFNDDKELEKFSRAVAYKIKLYGSELFRNNLYVDIADTPIDEFEARLNKQIGGIFDSAITRALGAENFEGHGFII